MHKKTPYCLTVLVCALFYLVGCTSFPSKNLDPQKDNKLTYSKDLQECKEDHPESSAGLHYARWVDCMNLKSWR